MEALDNMNYLQTASRVCFIVAALAFILAMVLFFLLDIRNIFLIETGRAKSKAIQEMNERNQRTGKLRNDTGDLGAGNGLEESRAEDDKFKKHGREVLAPSEKKERTGRQDRNRSGTTVEIGGTAVLDRGRNKGKKGFKIVQKTIVIHTDENISA